jgi:hypothetical protein
MTNALKLMCSLLATPWLILLSTSIPLYLKNQKDLHYQFDVLFLYAALALGIALVATVLSIVSPRLKRNAALRYLIWAYYSAGITVVLMISIGELELGYLANRNLFVALLLALAALIAVADRKITQKQVIPFFAIISILYISTDILRLYSDLEINVPLHSKHNSFVVKVDSQLTELDRLPNIYHIILDEYQTEMFELTLNELVKEKLGGFQLFRNTTTVYGRTGMSLPSIFSGQEYDYQNEQVSYQKSAFNSEQSFLYWLRRIGYQVSAYVHPVYKFDQNLFEYLTFHRDLVDPSLNPRDKEDNQRTFNTLWLYSMLPLSIAKQVLDTEYIEQHENQNVLNPKAPVRSVNTMRRVIEEESRLAEEGRYVLVHLILPHFPYVLDSDCGYDPKRKKTSPLAQSRCATSLVIDFISKLKELGRFTESLLIFQSDHGGRFRVEEGRLVKEGDRFYGPGWSMARARSLLLIKPSGVSADSHALSVSEFPASLLDIAPTVLNQVKLGDVMQSVGVNLFDTDLSKMERKRYYHFYEKKDRNEWTDEMTRFVIEGNEIYFDSKIKLLNNPQQKP